MLNKSGSIRQLVILSGKGGTGKTSIAACLLHLSSRSEYSGVYVDADVDAANLALVTDAVPIETHAYLGSQSAEINPTLCDCCDLCYQVCRFNAIHKPEREQEDYRIIDLLCEGCAACVYRCPQSAIKMVKQQDGEWYHSTTPFGHLFHAELFPGAENTGKLITTVKQNAKLFAEDHSLPLMIIDGPPGIGCPVISASGGADLALLVAEPGASGLHDLERIIQTLKHFNVPVVVCINKADIYPEGTRMIDQFIKLHGLKQIGMIPFDQSVSDSIIHAQPLTIFAPESQASSAITAMWLKIQDELFNNGKI